LLHIVERYSTARLDRDEALAVLEGLATLGFEGVGFKSLKFSASDFKIPMSGKLVSQVSDWAERTNLSLLIDVFPFPHKSTILYLRHDRAVTSSGFVDWGEYQVRLQADLAVENFEDVSEAAPGMMLVAGVAAVPHGEVSLLDSFCEAVSVSIKKNVDGRRVRGMDLSWKTRRLGARDLRTFIKGAQEQGAKYEPPEYDMKEVNLTEELSSADLRRKLLEIMRLSKVRATDLLGEDVDKKVANLIDRLAGLGLLSREYLLVCAKTGHGLARLVTREEITAATLANVRCGQCGNRFAEEKVEEILLPSEVARRLTEGSRWMRVLLTNQLVTEGVQREDIVWNLSQNGEDIDVIASVLDRLVFFELKDREFGLGDAYPFSYRVARYQGDLGVIVSAEKVAPDARKFFEEQRESARRLSPFAGPASISFIEGFGPKNAELLNLLTRISMRYLSHRLSPGLRSFDLGHAMQAMFDSKAWE